MFGEKHYVPVLKWKRGEQRGLADVSESLRDAFTPLIEIVPIGTRPGTDQRRRSADAHVESAIDALIESWGTERPFFLDPGAISDEESDDEVAGHQLTYEAAAEQGLQFVPVLKLQHSVEELAVVQSHNQRGLCLRLLVEDLELDSLQDDIEEQVREIGIAREHIDIIIDLGSIYGMQASVARATSRELLRAIESIDEYRTVTVIASNFPSTLAAIGTNNQGYVPRTEWQIWRDRYSSNVARKQSGRTFRRMPTFGDYGIQHPAGVENLDMRIIQPAAAIRYALEDQWFIVKGRSIKRFGGAQFSTLAERLTEHPDFYGSDHCKGCEVAAEVVNEEATANSLELWRRHGTTHHITVAVSQVQVLPDL